jgi:hypothetical protein
MPAIGPDQAIQNGAVLRAHIAELERRLGLNSSNSGKPPSSDGLKKPPRVAMREPSGNKPGGQKGHEGETLRQVAEPNIIIDHYPQACAECGSMLMPAMATGHSARQVFDLPEPQPPVVTEHRAHDCQCATCGARTRAAFAQEEIVSGAAGRATAMFSASLCGGGRERWLGLVEGKALGEDGVITALESFDQARLERDAAIACAVGHLTGAAQSPSKNPMPRSSRKQPARVQITPTRHHSHSARIGRRLKTFCARRFKNGGHRAGTSDCWWDSSRTINGPCCSCDPFVSGWLRRPLRTRSTNNWPPPKLRGWLMKRGSGACPDKKHQAPRL